VRLQITRRGGLLEPQEITLNHVSKLKDLLLDKESAHALPTLKRLVSLPIALPDGRLLDVAGHDQATEIFVDLSPDVSAMIQRLRGATRHEALLALDSLFELFKDFGVTDPVSRAHLLTLLLASVMSLGSVCHCPVMLITSTQYGVGKTL